MNLLNELVYLSKLVGSDFDLNQAGGGNISIKAHDSLLIKSSGLTLSEVEKSYGITTVPLKSGQHFLSKLSLIDEASYGGELESLKSKNELRPSMESPLHLLLKKKYVIHCHPISVLALCCSSEGVNLLQQSIPEAVWVPYATPGLELARFFSKSVDLSKNIYFMQNHGLIIADDNIDSALELLIQTIETCSKLCKVDRSNDTIDILKHLFNSLSLCTSLLKSNDKTLMTNDLREYKVLCPDDVVYMGSQLLFIKDDIKGEIVNFYHQNKFLPRVIKDKESLYIQASSIKKCKLIEEQLRANILVSSMLSCDQELDQKEVHFLSNWEAEKYRAKGK